jgi:uncharacterized OB-fold protein
VATDRPPVAPEISPEAKPFWDAANAGRLVVATCLDCGRGHHYPRALCPHCHSTRLEFRDAKPPARIYSFSVVGSGAGQYIIAYVEIADRVAMMANIIGCAPESVHIGQTLTPVFIDSASGQKVVMFTAA